MPAQAQKTQAQPKRSEAIKNLLRSRSHFMTVREVVDALGLPVDKAKFVSSFLVTEAQRLPTTNIEVLPSMVCMVTNRKCQGYRWVATPIAPSRPRPAAGPIPKAPPHAAPAAPTPPPPPPKAPRLSPAERIRAEVRRKTFEAAKAARQRYHDEQIAHDRRQRAALTFVRITGCKSKDPVEMKKAYRAAALKHHPDRGGNTDTFAELAAAWTEIERSL